MKDKLDIVMIDDEKKEKLVHSVQYGLMLAKDSIEGQGLWEKNGLGLFSLNYIFKATRIVCVDEFQIFQFQRGPFKTIFLFDETTKTVISFTSKANLKRLVGRKRVSKIHYIDAFTLLNADFREPQQLCIFDDVDSVENDLRELKEDILFKLGELRPEQYLTITYEINHWNYQLLSISADILSPHYFTLYHESLNHYISVGEIEKIDSQSVPQPDEWGYTQENPQNYFTLTFKTQHK